MSKHSLPLACPLTLFFAVCLALSPPPAHAQGCAHCLDAAQATPPAVQSAYRHAILLLASAGASLFVAGAFIIHRNR